MLYAHSRRSRVAHSQAADWARLARLRAEAVNAVADGDEAGAAKATDAHMDHLAECCWSVVG